jgi:hypothetical protein
LHLAAGHHALVQQSRDDTFKRAACLDEFHGLAAGIDLPVEIVMRDNDGKYPAQFDEVLKSGGAKIKRNTPWSPNLRAHVERVIQTLKQEVLDHFVVVASSKKQPEMWHIR